MEKCLNCNTEFTVNYCNNCGQKRTRGDLTIKMVFSDFIESVFLFDSSLHKTLIGLLLKPGKTVQSYLEGKRKKYFPPFQFFLLFMTIYLLILAFFGDTYFEYVESGLQLESDNISEDIFLENFVRKNLNILYFIFVPILAFFINLFYKKIKFNYAEILLFLLYVMGIMFFLSSIMLLLGQINTIVFTVKSLIGLGYLIFAIVQFTNTSSFWGITKALLTVVLSYTIFALIILVFVSFYIEIFV